MIAFASLYFAVLAVLALGGLADLAENVPSGIVLTVAAFLFFGFFWLVAETELRRRDQ